MVTKKQILRNRIIAVSILSIITFSGGFMCSWAMQSPPEKIEVVEYVYVATDNEDIVENVVTPISTAPIENGNVLNALAQTIWGEARGCSIQQKEAVAWCILNRVDDGRFPSTIMGVITQPNQFHGYRWHYPITDECYEIAVRVTNMWHAEKQGNIVDRVLPKEYLYFYGDGKINYFTKDWRSREVWNWRN